VGAITAVLSGILYSDCDATLCLSGTSAIYDAQKVCMLSQACAQGQGMLDSVFSILHVFWWGSALQQPQQRKQACACQISSCCGLWVVKVGFYVGDFMASTSAAHTNFNNTQSLAPAVFPLLLG
jgi:hypothetical protein